MPDVFLKLFNRNFADFPTVLTVHGTMQMLRDLALMARSLFSDLESAEKSTLLFYPIIRLLEQNYVKRVSALIAVSKITKALAIKHLNIKEEKINLIYNGVDTEVFRSPSKREEETKYAKPTVMYVGRMVTKKGIHVLIKAMPEVLKVFPEARFVFVGGGDVPLYKGIIRKMGIAEKNFSFTGHLWYFERPTVLKKATVFVNPSFFENCSLSILEAMSCNAAVVASDVGGNSEIIESGRNGVLTPLCDHKMLAESIISLLTDDRFNKRVGREARKTVEERFSSPKCAEQTYNVYKHILDGAN
jgi:glycosyltransferase involved in cell wall biosynthesis